MQTVKSEIIEKLKTNSKARYRLCYEFNSHMNTIERMIENNDMRLTTPMAVTAIAEELDVKESEVLTDKAA